MSISLESAIQDVYREFPEAVEPILTTAKLRSQFIERVLSICPNVTEDAILQHLVRLRKRGAKKGGLPRKAK